MIPTFTEASHVPDIYLDHNASTPIDPRVVAVMRPLLDGPFANPSATHSGGRTARALLDRARAQVADLLGCGPDEIVFTSGGSEADNLALTGVFFALKGRGDHIITTTVEHPAILEPLRFLERLGARVTVIPVDRTGMIDPEDLRRAITPRTILVSVMHANNEVGTLQPIAAVAAIAHAPGALVHTDAAQSPAPIPPRVDALGEPALHRPVRGDVAVAVEVVGGDVRVDGDRRAARERGELQLGQLEDDPVRGGHREGALHQRRPDVPAEHDRVAGVDREERRRERRRGGLALRPGDAHRGRRAESEEEVRLAHEGRRGRVARRASRDDRRERRAGRGV